MCTGVQTPQTQGREEAGRGVGGEGGRLMKAIVEMSDPNLGKL